MKRLVSILTLSILLLDCTPSEEVETIIQGFTPDDFSPSLTELDTFLQTISETLP